MVQRFMRKFGIKEKQLRYNFKWDGKWYYVPTFNPLWWTLTIIFLFLTLRVLKLVVSIITLFAQ